MKIPRGPERILKEGLPVSHGKLAAHCDCSAAAVVMEMCNHLKEHVPSPELYRRNTDHLFAELSLEDLPECDESDL